MIFISKNVRKIASIFVPLQRHKVNAVSWSKANEDIVISGDEIGNLAILDVKCNATRNVNFGKHCIFVLETHPFDSDIVAFGCRLGLVFIVNITGKSICLEQRC